MPDQTTYFGAPGEVPAALPSLALTATEKSWQFYGEGRGVAERREGILGFVCDVAWFYATRAGGPYLPVPASTFVNFPVKSGLTYFVKTQSGTGTLSTVVTG